MKIKDKEMFDQANVFGQGMENSAYARYFIGKSYLNPLTKPGESAISLANVTFEPGCRNNWHIHHAKTGGGQILVIVIPPEVKHWHGAKADSWFSHIAFEVPGTETSNEWLEEKDDEAYAALSF